METIKHFEFEKNQREKMLKNARNLGSLANRVFSQEQGDISISPESYMSLLEKVKSGTASQAEIERYDGIDRGRRIEAGIRLTAPELFYGRLPESQMDKYEVPDNYDYVLAVNRNGINDYSQLTSYINENSGVHTNTHGDKSRAFSDRFYVPGHIRESSMGIKYSCDNELVSKLQGYGSGFNFVTCIPFKVETEQQRQIISEMAVFDVDGQNFVRNLIENNMTPDDLVISKDGQNIINKKYLAGIVDNDGLYIENTNLFK